MAEEKQEEDYVASTLNITYKMPKGIVHLLTAVSGKSSKEVWCIISELANVCALRLSTRKNQSDSWTKKTFPNTDVELRIDMKKKHSVKWDGTTYIKQDKPNYFCRIKINGMTTESFTQTQINDYITENILLDLEDEVA